MDAGNQGIRFANNPRLKPRPSERGRDERNGIMGDRRTVVVLADEDPNITEFMERLRREGWRVLSTTRPYEAALLVAARPVAALIVRERLLPDENEFLRQISRLDGAPLVILSHEGEREPREVAGLVHEWLREPFSYSELLDALEVGLGHRSRSTVRAGSRMELPEGAPVIHRVVECCRRLSELERDREELLTRSLELFMEVTDAERGSLMLRTSGPGELRLVRGVGFPEGSPDDVTVKIGTEIAGSVCARGEPLLVEVDARFTDRMQRGYVGRSFLVAPIRADDATLGVVNLTNRRGGEVFGQDDLAHCTMLGAQLAVSLRNAQTLEDLHEMTVIDPLTHLYNRRHFDRELKKEIERARRYKRKLTLALLDIDKFKQFNDTRGYVTGDVVLKHVGQVIQESFREVDVVTRWGGDEFAVLLPETDRPDAGDHSNFIERLRESLRSVEFPARVSAGDGVTVSIGIATYPTDCRSEAELFRAANRALQRAKKAGGDQCRYAEEEEEA